MQQPEQFLKDICEWKYIGRFIDWMMVGCILDNTKPLLIIPYKEQWPDGGGASTGWFVYEGKKKEE